MPAQLIHADSRFGEPRRYTLVFRDGQLLRHQDGLSVAQYRSDARVAAVHPEPAGRRVA